VSARDVGRLRRCPGARALAVIGALAGGERQCHVSGQRQPDLALYHPFVYRVITVEYTDSRMAA